MFRGLKARTAFDDDRVYFPLCAVLLVFAVGIRWFCLRVESHDVGAFLLPWTEYILRHGRFASLADDFYDYAPAYIYLLSAGSFFIRDLGLIVVIKAINFLFEALAAVFVFRLVQVAWGDRRRSWFCVLLFLDLPTVILNSSVWAQCDIIYTACLLGFLYFVLVSRPLLAALMYGFAFAFKLQTVFLAPFFLLLIARRRLPSWVMLIVAAVYIVLVLPAALAGRGLIDLMTIYVHQAGENQTALVLGAPNIANLFRAYIAPGAVPALTLLNLVLAGLITTGLLAMQLRMRPRLSNAFIVTGATFWLAVEPMILPKMHERYFFPADVFSFVLAAWMPRYWWVAILFQLASALAYSGFLVFGTHLFTLFHLIQVTRAADVASVLAIIGTVSVGVLLWKRKERALLS